MCGCILACLPLHGCASRPTDTESRIEAGDYPRAFDAAKDLLRSYEFELDRVDAHAGVITTAPRAWAGFATPWLPYASGTSDAMRGFAQFEQIRVKVAFDPASATASNPARHGDDRRADTGPLVARFEVELERIHRPGRRFDPTSVRLSSTAVDPVLRVSGLQPWHSEQVGTDARLAAQLSQALDNALKTPAPAAHALDEPVSK